MKPSVFAMGDQGVVVPPLSAFALAPFFPFGQGNPPCRLI